MSYRATFVCIALSALVVGCEGSATSNKEKGAPSVAKVEPNVELSPEVAAANSRLGEVNAKTKIDGGKITEVAITDGSSLTDADIDMISKLVDLKKLQILNCRMLNDEMVAKLGGLKQLSSLALTNTVINDPSVEFIVKTFPELKELDLSSNTNMTSTAMKTIAELTGLQSLILVQNRFNELSTRRLKTLTELRSLDLRGNMEAGNMTMGVVGQLPKLTSFKHRSTAVTDDGMEKLAAGNTLENLLIQDFMITGQSGQHLAKLTNLKQLEVFRCQGFDSEGVLALKGLGLDRLTLRDLPAVSDEALAVFSDLPNLKRLYLHELETISDEGLKNLSALKSLEQLDVWSVTHLTDATIDVIAALPNLRDLSLRTTGITDNAIDKILAMPKLSALTLKENGSVTPEGLKKLQSKKWNKLDTGSGK